MTRLVDRDFDGAGLGSMARVARELVREPTDAKLSWQFGPVHYSDTD